MPIAIACKACGTKYNVPDQLAGRSAKCKCGSPIAVPAGAARAVKAAAPRPAPARPAAVEQEIEIGEGDVVETAAPSSASPLGSFSINSLDDLEVPPKMQEPIRAEIKPDEKIVWMGRPLMSYARKTMWIGFFAGLIFLLIGGGVLAYFLTSDLLKKEDTPGAAVIVYIAVPGVFVLVGLIFVTMPLWYGRLTPYRDVYILTDQRAIVADYESWTRCNVRSYTAAQMTQFGSTEYGSIPGAGDVKFFTEMVKVGHYDPNRLEDPYVAKTRQTFGRTIPRDRGFLMIENVRQVAALVRQTLLNKPIAQRPRR